MAEPPDVPVAAWQNGGEPYAEDGVEGDLRLAGRRRGPGPGRVDHQQGLQPGERGQDSQYVGFKNGKLAITWDGIWQINDLKERPGQLRDRPRADDLRRDAAWANSHNFFITKQATRTTTSAQAAQVFIDWMSKQSARVGGRGHDPGTPVGA